MIRAARPEDVGQIAALVRASFDERLHDFMVYAQHGIDRFIAVHVGMPLTKPARQFLVDVDDWEAVRGFAEFQSDAATDIAFLSYICVTPRARGTGVASGLIESFLISAQPAALQLDVFAENCAALALYRKLGFSRAGTTGWFTRDLPRAAPNSALRLTDALETTAMHAHYGFCRHGMTWREDTTFLGRIGQHTLRCFRPADFADDRLLAAARALFPKARHALFVCPTDAADRPDEGLLFNTSQRLVRNTVSSRED